MSPATVDTSLASMLQAGGFTMWVLLACSLLVWGVIFERIWSFRRLGQELGTFHLRALNALTARDKPALKRIARESSALPTARLLDLALDRLESSDERVRDRWVEA